MLLGHDLTYNAGLGLVGCGVELDAKSMNKSCLDVQGPEFAYFWG